MAVDEPGADVRERLIVAATELLAERPTGGVTVRDIADRAGLHHSLIHRHFGGKEQLLKVVTARLAMQYWEAVYTAEVTPEDPAAGFKAALDYLQRDPGERAAAFAGLLLGDPAAYLVQESFPGVELHVAQLQRLLDGASTTKRDPRLITVAAVALIGGWTLLEDWAMRAGGLEDLSQKEVRSQIVEILDDMVRSQLQEPTADDQQHKPRRSKRAPAKR